jgi:hypothetical protein
MSASVPTTPVKSHLPPSSAPTSPATHRSPEKSAHELAEKIEMMDKLASEARQKLQEMEMWESTGKAKATGGSSSKRPKSAVQFGSHEAAPAAAAAATTTSGPVFTPLAPEGWLQGAKERNQANIRKLVEQRDETRKIVVAREKEIKAAKYQMAKLKKEHAERENFDRRLIDELKVKTQVRSTQTHNSTARERS